MREETPPVQGTQSRSRGARIEVIGGWMLRLHAKPRKVRRHQ